MKLSDIKKLAESWVDDTIDDTTALMWLNDCSDDIASVIQIPTTVTIPYNGELQVTLPDDMYEIISVKVNGTQLTDIGKNKGYKVAGNKIIFNEPYSPGTIDIEYFKTTAPFTSLGNTPEIPPSYHRIYALWLAYNYWVNYGDEFETENSFYSKYLQLKSELLKYATNKNSVDYYETEDVLPRRNILDTIET